VSEPSNGSGGSEQLTNSIGLRVQNAQRAQRSGLEAGIVAQHQGTALSSTTHAWRAPHGNARCARSRLSVSKIQAELAAEHGFRSRNETCAGLRAEFPFVAHFPCSGLQNCRRRTFVPTAVEKLSVQRSVHAMFSAVIPEGPAGFARKSVRAGFNGSARPSPQVWQFFSSRQFAALRFARFVAQALACQATHENGSQVSPFPDSVAAFSRRQGIPVEHPVATPQWGEQKKKQPKNLPGSEPPKGHDRFISERREAGQSACKRI
jgi:hypothetical protein